MTLGLALNWLVQWGDRWYECTGFLQAATHVNILSK